ncbi:MAG TPA: VOC family protein [Gaiellaceae bacterium]
MEPRINVVTLSVRDLERSLAFYREGLGLSSPGVTGTKYPATDKDAPGDVAMFELEDGLILALYPRTALAKDSNVDPGDARSGEFSLGQIVPSKDDVDAVLAQAERAGGTITEPPRERPWGIYSGYFRDPDGHLWEIIWDSRAR